MVELDSYSETNQSSFHGLKDEHPSNINKNSAAGQSFTCPGVYKITSVKFYLKKTGSPINTSYAKLYAHAGTYGTSSVPTGAVLATSDGLDISTLTGSYQLITLSFTGVQQYQMSSVYYCIIFEAPATEGSVDDSNFINVGVDNTSSTHDGNSTVFRNGGWVAAASDCCFYVYGDLVKKPAPGSIIPLMETEGMLIAKNTWSSRFPKLVPRLVC